MRVTKTVNSVCLHNFLQQPLPNRLISTQQNIYGMSFSKTKMTVFFFDKWDKIESKLNVLQVDLTTTTTTCTSVDMCVLFYDLASPSRFCHYRESSRNSQVAHLYALKIVTKLS